MPTFGHEMLSSMPATPGHAVEPPRDLDVVLDRLPGDVHDDRHLPAPSRSPAYFSMTASTPGFWRPIELSIPPGVSVTRGVGLPIRGLSVVPLQQIAAEPIDVDDVAVLDAVAERARGDEDRVGQHEPAPQVDATGRRRPRSGVAPGRGRDGRDWGRRARRGGRAAAIGRPRRIAGVGRPTASARRRPRRGRPTRRFGLHRRSSRGPPPGPARSGTPRPGCRRSAAHSSDRHDPEGRRSSGWREPSSPTSPRSQADEEPDERRRP